MAEVFSRRLEAKSLAGVLILAGGLSTRMGSPKALLKLPSGETLLDYHVRSAAQLGVPILIADNGQGFATQVEAMNSTINYIQDYQPHSSNPEADSKHSAGPLGAILAGMKQLLAGNESKWLLVVSCDSLVNSFDIWQYLAEEKAQNLTNSATVTNEHNAQPQMYCLADNERDYPLLALYQLALTEPLKAYLDSGERRVMRFISPVSQSVSMPKDWYMLSNLNTPEQFQIACQQLWIKLSRLFKQAKVMQTYSN